MIESISAITLATHDMARAVRFYRMLGFEIIRGGEDAAFTSFRAGSSYLNLIAQPAARKWSWWGRVIFYRPDALHARGSRPAIAPIRRDAEWGEHFFHLTARWSRAQLCLAAAMRTGTVNVSILRRRHGAPRRCHL